MQYLRQIQASLSLALCLVLPTTAYTEDIHHPAKASAHSTIHYEPEIPHHLSLFLGGTRLNQGAHDEGFTYGVDYEYRINRRFGVGAVVERAAGTIDATTVLLVTDIHLWQGLALQVGPGIERVEGESITIGRFGVLYEFTRNDLTFAPMVHYDFGASESSTIFGIAVGKAF